MIRLIYSGVSGLRSHQVRMDIIGNNISNINTTGYKTSRALFQDALYQTINGAGIENNQVGTGVNVASVAGNFNQGMLQATGRPLDLAIVGNGFFGVLDKEGNLQFTRDGSFYIDKQGYLVNAAGLQVVNKDQNPISLSFEKDQSIDDLIITEKGDIYIENDFKGTIGLFSFTNVAGLTRAGDNLYLQNNNCGEMVSNEEGPEGFGEIRSGFLEASNIDIAEELANLIISQRGFQANAKVFTTADEIMQDIVQLKR